MTEKELKKLKRVDLLELLLAQIKENEKLQAELQKASEELQSRKIAIENAGSIAEASLQLNGVFKAVEAAGAQYLENIQRLKLEQVDICARLEAESREKSSKLLNDTEERCRKMELETEKKCNDMISRAEIQSKAYWDTVTQRLEQFYSDYIGLRELLSIKVPGEYNDNE